MTALTSFSIWLMPGGEIYAALSATIARLSRQFAAPVFPPHVTLLGNITGSETELSAQTRRLAAQIAPFQVNLTTVDFLDEYFRCLFLRVEETPGLLEANRAARFLFHREQGSVFMPHLSLMYGNFDIETIQQIVASIGREFNRPFSVNHISLFTTAGEPKDWSCVQKSELQGKVA